MELVVGASAGTVRSVMGKLGGLLAHEYTLIRGVDSDLQYINDELISMQCCLRDFSGAQINHGHRMKDWMRQIRDITYDIEDCIDDSSHRLHPLHPNMCCYVLVKPVHEILTWRPRRDVAVRISVLKMRAQQISERRERYGFHNLETGGGTEGSHPGVQSAIAEFDAADNQKACLQIVAPKVPVGMEEYMEELQSWFTSTTTSGVRYLVGSGGMGKTTIATALYQKFADQFDHRAMVTVSQSSDGNAVLTNIKNQVMPQSSSQNQESSQGILGRLKRGTSAFAAKCYSAGTSEEIRGERKQLKKELEKHFGTKSYLVLVDDVCSATTWDEIRQSLPKCNPHSRIIVTTRFQAVATSCRGEGHNPHQVVPLSDEKSEKLFNQAFLESSGSGVPNIPKKVWKMCGGVPLAIVTMAGHVACNPSKSREEWLQLCRCLIPESVKDHGKDGSGDLTQEQVGRIISHCYNDMPVDIKTCSLHLSIFPKGHIMSKKRLTRRWAAEGFFGRKQGLSVEDVAEACFNYLIKRKIIQPVGYSSNGKVKTCIVHDMVLEQIVVRSGEEKFIAVVGGDQDNWLSHPNSKVRRLSLQESDYKHANDAKKMNLSHVRSLTMFGSLNQLPSHSFKFGIMEFLDLEGCVGFKPRHIEEICEMLLLKFLSLRRTDIKILPDSMRKLENLETLDIRETNVVELPKTVCQLERLVNILGGNKRTRRALRLPEELSKKKKMKALRILSGIEIDWRSADLHHLTELRKLTIYKLNFMWGKASFQALSSSIEYLSGYSLRTLVIDDESCEFIKSLDGMSPPPKFLTSLELCGKMVKPPGWIKELGALNNLTISLTALREDNLRDLSNLSTLFSLTFSLRAEKQDPQTLSILAENKMYSNGEVIIPAGGFKSLKLLRFIAPLLPSLSFSEEAMPELERLELQYNMLEGLFGVEKLASLREVHLTSGKAHGYMTEEIVREMKSADKRINAKKLKIIQKMCL